VVDRPQVGLDFTPVKGGAVAHLKPVLRTAETGELEKLLSGASPRKRLAIAKEIASRCINTGDVEKASSFFQIAMDASEHEHERWGLRLRMLEEGLGYPPANKKRRPWMLANLNGLSMIATLKGHAMRHCSEYSTSI